MGVPLLLELWDSYHRPRLPVQEVLRRGRRGGPSSVKIATAIVVCAPNISVMSALCPSWTGFGRYLHRKGFAVISRGQSHHLTRSHPA